MAILFKSLKLIDSSKILPEKDYLYTGSLIIEFQSSDAALVKEEIDCRGLFASKGWVDLRCMGGDPGLEHKESIESLGETLKHSGFVKAVLLPNTEPAIQSKNEVQYIKNKASGIFPELIIQGAATINTQGEDFTEILDIQKQGVNIFGNGTHTISNPDRFLKILLYLKKFNGILFDHSYDPLLALFGQMHEGEVSTQLGLKGIPNLSEDVAIQRNLALAEYAEGRVHFQTISTAKSVEYIREAKKKGLNVTADVSLYQLIFSDEDLKDFDSHLKVLPPFRGQTDKQALIAGLKDGTIDAIVSNHQPQDFDGKHMEFDLAAWGMIGLQTFLPGLVKLAEELTWPLLIQKITDGPNKVIGAESNNFDSLTVFDPHQEWNYNQDKNTSESSNSPWFNQSLKGRVKFVIRQSRFHQLYE
jgi:dihydroorotase